MRKRNGGDKYQHEEPDGLLLAWRRGADARMPALPDRVPAHDRPGAGASAARQPAALQAGRCRADRSQTGDRTAGWRGSEMSDEFWTMKEIGVALGVTSHVIGKRLKEIGLRTADGKPSGAA